MSRVTKEQKSRAGGVLDDARVHKKQKIRIGDNIEAKATVRGKEWARQHKQDFPAGMIRGNVLGSVNPSKGQKKWIVKWQIDSQQSELLARSLQVLPLVESGDIQISAPSIPIERDEEKHETKSDSETPLITRDLLNPHGLQWTPTADISVDAAASVSFGCQIAWVEQCPPQGRNELQYFRHMFPMQILPEILGATNAEAKTNFTEAEFFQVIGLILSQSLVHLRHFRNWFQTYQLGDLVEPHLAENGFSLTRTRTELLLSSLRYSAYSQEDEAKDPWVSVRNLIQGYNDRRAFVHPGKVLCADEDTSKWTAAFSDVAHKLGGVPHLTKIKMKPEPISMMLKSLVCAESGINLKLELSESKEHMAQKAFGHLGAGTGCLLRLTNRYWGSQRVVVGDSWFSSVKAATELFSHGLFYIGQVKTATVHFPKKYLQQIEYPTAGARSVRFSTLLLFHSL
jgi:hypothetical protein